LFGAKSNIVIALTREAWAVLRHAYGSANDIPALLQAAEADPSPREHYTEEPWFTLWSALCHQGDVYSASFAASPHLLRIAANASGPCAWDLFGLPVSIEIARVRNQVDVPATLVEAYQAALVRLPETVCRHLGWEWNHTFTQAATAALALSKGHIDLAEAIVELGPTTVERFLADDR
jgi:hypothetical protein